MEEWWAGLSLLEKIFACCAAPSSFLIILTGIVSAIGLEIDALCHIDIPFDNPLGIFNFKGILAFFSIGGLTGLALASSPCPTPISIAGSIPAGGIAMKATVSIINYCIKNESKGNVKKINAVGNIGKVYIPIEGERKSKGKISIKIQGRLVELDPVTDRKTPLKTGDRIMVIDMDESGTLVVEPATKYIAETES